ncbi:hypothetical protein AWC38_SpisGene1541 [Stylophora pistillata]|uniref:G protein-coupled receptor n=1 Tax=Stylophora pistillata TaxID=50429 RepID=A0A2B4SY87_STYPI|nr:hypothetical protein AWC38_SpisGene1541 [Stylophora pistillata]
MIELLPVLSSILLMLAVHEKTRPTEHVYDLVSSSPLFSMERHLLRESDCSLDLSDIAGEINPTTTSILESTALTVVSLQENGTCIIETICDPRVITFASKVVNCMNLTFCERNQSNGENIPLYLKLISEKPRRKRTPNPRLRCTLEFSNETEKRYRINTTVAFKVSEEAEIWEFIRSRRANHSRSRESSVLLELSKTLRLLPVAFYAPYVLTFFLPTRITQDHLGLQQINLEGVSPVSVRSAIGNCFISSESKERIVWAEVVTMICLRVLPSLALFIKTSFTQFTILLVVALCAVDCVNLLIKFAHTLFKGKRRKDELRRCETCYRVGDYRGMLRCQNLSLPERISFHLRKQPYLFLLFCNRCYEHLKKLCVHVSNFPSTFLGILWFFVSLFHKILVTIDYLLYELLKANHDLLLTTPSFTMILTSSDYRTSHNGHHWFYPNESVFFASFIESMTVLVITEFIHALIMSAFPILLLEKNLPYLICFCLSCHYCMDYYSAFSKKYQNLGWILFKQYNQPTAVTSRFSPVVIIPQELFDRACEELMPIRNSVCELLVGLIISLAPAYIVFVHAEVPEDHVLNGLTKFLSMLFPKIILSFRSTVHSKIETAATKIKVDKIIADWNISRAQHPHQD